jgi:hypothetical protein
LSIEREIVGRETVGMKEEEGGMGKGEGGRRELGYYCGQGTSGRRKTLFLALQHKYNFNPYSVIAAFL